MSPGYDKRRQSERTVLSVVNNTEARENANLEPIRIFITVAEMGSFTHAADSLGIQKGRASNEQCEAGRRCRCQAPASDDAQRAVDGGRTRISCPCPRSAC